MRQRLLLGNLSDAAMRPAEVIDVDQPLTFGWHRGEDAANDDRAAVVRTFKLHGRLGLCVARLRDELD